MSGANEVLAGVVAGELALALVGIAWGVRSLERDRRWWQARADELLREKRSGKRSDETREEERKR